MASAGPYADLICTSLQTDNHASIPPLYICSYMYINFLVILEWNLCIAAAEWCDVVVVIHWLYAVWTHDVILLSHWYKTSVDHRLHRVHRYLRPTRVFFSVKNVVPLNRMHFVVLRRWPGIFIWGWGKLKCKDKGPQHWCIDWRISFWWIWHLRWIAEAEALWLRSLAVAIVFPDLDQCFEFPYRWLCDSDS